MFDILEHIPKGFSPLERHYAAGSAILDPATENEFFYILIDGTASVYHWGSEGQILQLYTYRAVDCFGEMELLGSRHTPLFIQAKSACHALLLHRDDFLAWLDIDHAFSRWIMGRLCDKLMDCSNRLAAFSMLTLRKRYLLALLRHLDLGNLPTVSKRQIAEEVGSPLRSLNRIIAQHGDVAVYQNNRFHIVDEALLRQKAAQ